MLEDIIKIIEKETSKEYILEFVNDGKYKINIPTILESSEYGLIVIHDNNRW